MKKILLLFLVLVFWVSMADAVTVPNKESGNTVSFSSVNHAVNRPARIVSFNSVTKSVTITNMSSLSDCWVDLKCVDANGKRGYATKDTCTLLVPAAGKTSPNSVTLEFATLNLGFASIGVTGVFENASVNYEVIGDYDL